MKNVNTDVAYDYIRQRILSGEYPPGHALMTAALAPEVGVSRTPVREALRKLETDGLVTIRPHLGASVKSRDLKEYREMCDLRLALESHAAGRAASNHNVDDLREIGVALEELRQATKNLIAPSPKAKASFLENLKRGDARFHIAIITAAKNDVLKKEILRLHLISRVLAAPALERESEHDEIRHVEVMASHDAIYAAIARRDGPAAKSAMESHLQGRIDEALRVMKAVAAGSTARELSPEELAYSS